MHSRTDPITAVSKKLSIAHVVALFIVYVAFTWIVAGPGMLHYEMDVRFPAHISGKPLFQTIFDAKSMNLGGWEARQLSFVFDVIDGNFVAFCIRHGFPHFRSLTHYVFTFLIMLYLWSFLTRILKLDRLLSILLIALLLTTPSFIYAYYYRTSKIGVTLFMVILLSEMYKVIKGDIYLNIKIKKPLWIIFTFLLATLSLMLFDVLGGFFAAALIAYLFFALVYKPDQNKSAALVGMLIGYVLWGLYFLYLGPVLTLIFSGHNADSSYLTGAPWADLPHFLFVGTPPLIVDMVQYLFGYLSQAGGAILLAWVFTTSLWLTSRPKKKTLKAITTAWDPRLPRQQFILKLRSFISRYEPLLTLFFILGSITIIYGLLATRHPPMLSPDVRPTYYIMPAQAALLFSTAIFLARARIKWFFKFPRIRYFAIVLLVFFLVGNTIGSIRIKVLLYSGQNVKLFPHDAALIDSLAHIHSANFKPNENVATDPIYQLFSNP